LTFLSLLQQNKERVTTHIFSRKAKQDLKSGSLVHGGNKSRQADKIPDVYLIKRYFEK